MHITPHISVIIPVYNTEPYLNDCIASVVCQSYEHIQIILVNDGSTDGSGAICDAWAARDSRITVIHQKNAGVSAARNAALDVAEGEWISFVDSDDILMPDAYVHLLESLGDRDLVMGNMVLLDQYGEQLPSTQAGTPAGFSHEEFLRELFQEKRCMYLGYLCDKMLRREIIERHRIRFDSGIRLNEDRLFLLEYLLHCSDIAFCDAVMYGYRQRSSGVITATRRNRTVTDSEMTVIDSFEAMSVLARTHTEELYYIVCRKAFESGLDLLSRTAPEDREKRRGIRQFLRKNAGICLKTPGLPPVERAKIIVHCVLER